ncbi:MAG: 6-carboxytetrahydropterin synthase, partial [Lachnospiraceae bacterium]|nr:6-carboxytetrahydropterin synthase [Lachnospiraceae bacterium]
MYILKTSASFDSAHFLHEYKGKCANLHGHRWVIEAEFSGGHLKEEGNFRGMLIDFGDIK